MRDNMCDPFLSHHAPLCHLLPPGRVEAARSGAHELHAAPAQSGGPLGTQQMRGRGHGWASGHEL